MGIVGDKMMDVEGEPVTTAEQDAYSRTVIAAMKILYSDETHEKIMQLLQSGQRPDQALADVSAAIMMELDKQSGGRVPEMVILPAAMEVLAMLGELAEKAGVFDGSEEVITSAAQQVVLKLIEEYGADPADVQAIIGRLDPARVKEMVKEQKAAAGSWANEGQGQGQGQPQGEPVPAQPQGPAVGVQTPAPTAPGTATPGAY